MLPFLTSTNVSRNALSDFLGQNYPHLHSTYRKYAKFLLFSSSLFALDAVTNENNFKSKMSENSLSSSIFRGY